MGAARASQSPCRIPASLIRLGLALFVVSTFFVAWSSTASAVPYKVEVCTRASVAVDGIPATAGEGIVTGLTGETGASYAKNCEVDAPESGAIHQGTPGGPMHEGAEASWAFFAPDGAKIIDVEMTQKFHRTLGNPSFLYWKLFVAGQQTLFIQEDGRLFFPQDERKKYTINGNSIQGTLYCPIHIIEVCSGGEFTLTFQDIVATLDDQSPPVVEPPFVPATVRGVVGTQFVATDGGSGVADLILIVDGQRQPAFHDDNDGHCHEPYKYVTPCRKGVQATLPLDTTKLPDGAHQVAVAVIDGTGQEAVSAPVSFTVHNAPVNTSQPRVHGSAVVGGTLEVDTGRWLGEPSAYAYQWLRCPVSNDVQGDTTGCAAVPGATAQKYATVPDDLQRRLVVEITAKNAAGTGRAISFASDPVVPVTRRRKPPVLSHVTLSRKRFRVGGTSASSSRGAILSFSCSKAGHLALIIERGRGKKAKPISKLAAMIKSGRSTVLLTGEVGTRRLSPGKYRVTIRVRDAKGTPSDAVSVPFTILPG